MRLRSYSAAAFSLAALHAASPTAWETTTYQDFVKGKFENIALSKDGRLSLSPRLEAVFASEEPAVWSISRAADGAVYLGTGHRGKLYKIGRDGKSEVIFSAPEAEIFALALDAAGRVYAGTSPGGKIYRIENGKSSEYYATGATYIWSLAFGKDGALYAGAGNEGKIYRVTAQGQGETYYETGQGHVTSLAVDPEGRLLAGTEPNGILYRVTAKDKAFVIYDASLPEIRSIVAEPDGTIYLAAMGGSVARQTTQPAGSKPVVTSNISVSATSTSITVTDEAAQQGEIKPKPAETAAQPAAAATTLATSIIDYPGVEKSAIYKIRPDLTVETLWSSTEENAYDLVRTAQGLLFGADNQGRVYRLDDKRRNALLVETRDGEVLRLLPTNGDVWVVTGDPGKLYRLPGAHAEKGEFESNVHDAGGAARWGKLTWSAASCQGCRVAMRVRTGNSARPDKTWSDWSAPLTDSAGSAIPAPNARYVQWKIELAGSAASSPTVDWVRLPYLPQNATPVLKSLTVSAQTASAGATKTAAASTAASYSITVTDTGDAGASSASGTATQPLTRASREQLLLSWLGEDTDGDRLTYSIHFRPESEPEWTLAKADLGETLFLVDAEALADGRYFFRVTASDAPVNPPGDGREAEIVSAPILIDRTPPSVTLGAPTRQGADTTIAVDVVDAASPLKACEYSIDAGEWRTLASADGVLDSPRESFAIRLTGLTPGPHLLVVRARDSAENAGLARVTLR
ncbi:MAG: hypothetical protein R2729_12945 [Bryobacteraceae bacterium]